MMESSTLVLPPRIDALFPPSITDKWSVIDLNDFNPYMRYTNSHILQMAVYYKYRAGIKSAAEYLRSMEIPIETALEVLIGRNSNINGNSNNINIAIGV